MRIKNEKSLRNLKYSVYNLYNKKVQDTDGELDPWAIVQYVDKFGEKIESIDGEVDNIYPIGLGTISLSIYIQGNSLITASGIRSEEGIIKNININKISINNVHYYFFRNNKYREKTEITTFKLDEFNILLSKWSGNGSSIVRIFTNKTDFILDNYNKNENEVLEYSK